MPSPVAPTPAPSGVGPVRADGAAPAGILVKTIPALAVQQQGGILLIAFHDNTLKVGQFYRYRIRVVLANPLLGQDAVQDKNRDSYPKEIVGPWSEWSDECIVVNPTRFFLTGQSPGPTPQSQGILRLTVFTEKMGQPVMKVFDVQPGMAIGGTATVPVTIPNVGRALTPVDFSTGCVAAEFNMNRQYLKRGTTGPPFPVPTTSILYLDEKLRLRQRIQAEDVESPEYKKLLKEAGAGG